MLAVVSARSVALQAVGAAGSEGSTKYLLSAEA